MVGDAAGEKKDGMQEARLERGINGGNSHAMSGEVGDYEYWI